jgi:hypothetical protein
VEFKLNNNKEDIQEDNNRHILSQLWLTRINFRTELIIQILDHNKHKEDNKVLDKDGLKEEELEDQEFQDHNQHNIQVIIEEILHEEEEEGLKMFNKDQWVDNKDLLADNKWGREDKHRNSRDHREDRELRDRRDSNINIRITLEICRKACNRCRLSNHNKWL